MRAMMLVAAMALGGCASAADIYSSPVDLVETTTASPDAVSGCLQLKYETAPITTATGEQTFLLKNPYGVTLMMLTLKPLNPGTRIELRRPNGIGSSGPWRDCLKPSVS
jgi:hypothetical protein